MHDNVCTDLVTFVYKKIDPFHFTFWGLFGWRNTTLVIWVFLVFAVIVST